jgi:hypothetical protein
VYDGSSEEITSDQRTENMFSVVIDGTVKKDKSAAIITGLEKAYATLSDPSGTPKIQLVGKETHVNASDTSASVTKIYYTVTYGSDSIQPIDIEQPAESEIEKEIKDAADLVVIVSSPVSLKLRTFPMKGLYSTAYKVSLEKGIKNAYTSQEGTTATTAKTEVTVTSTEKHYYATSWEAATLVIYCVKVDGKDPESVDGVILPDYSAISSEINAEESSLEWCQCKSKKAYWYNVIGSKEDVSGKEEEWKAALLKAWRDNNQDIPEADLSLDSRPTIEARRKRATDDGSSLKDKDGNPVTTLENKAVVGSSDADVDDMFVTVPTEEQVSEALTAVPLTMPEGDLQICDDIMLKGSTTADVQENDIKDAIRNAYVKANPEVSAEDLEVTLNVINQNDDEGNPVSNVTYCISRKDGGNIQDLLEPTNAEKEEAFNEKGRQVYSPASAQKGGPAKWVTVVAGVCGAVALLLVIIAIIIVCSRHSTHDDKGSECGRQLYDEETYAGHGNFNTPIYDNKIMTGSWDQNGHSFYQAKINS